MSVRFIPCLTLHSDGKMQAPFEPMVKFFPGCGVLLWAFPRLVFMAVPECTSHQHFQRSLLAFSLEELRSLAGVTLSGARCLQVRRADGI